MHGQTCAQTLIQTGAVCVVLTVWRTAVCGSLYCARWEVAVAFSDLTTGRSIWHRQTHAEGQLQIAILAPSPLKANCIHPHRNRRLQHDIQPLSRWPCPCCTSPNQEDPAALNLSLFRCGSGSKQPQNLPKGALKSQLPAQIFTYPLPQPAHQS